DEDVEQLRQLVKAGASEESAQWRDARVLPHLEGRADDLVSVRQLVETIFGPALHGPELVDREWAAVAPDTTLPEQDRGTVAEADGDRRADEHWTEEDQRNRCADDVDDALDGALEVSLTVVDDRVHQKAVE